MFSQASDLFYKLFGHVWEDCTLYTTGKLAYLFSEECEKQ